MNREALENLVIEATGRRDKVSLIRTALNLAVAEISSQHLWSDLIVEDEVTITEGSSSVSLAADVTRVLEARVIDGTLSQVLDIRPKSWLISQVPDPISRSTARPVYGYLEGRVLYLIPRPNNDYTIRYTYCRLHPDLSTPTDELLIRHATAAVVAYANFWVFQTIEKSTEAASWYQIYATQLMSAKKVDKSNFAVKFKATSQRELSQVNSDYWLDPFVRKMP